MSSRRPWPAAIVVSALGLALVTALPAAHAAVQPAASGTLTPQAVFEGNGSCFIGGDPSATDTVSIDSLAAQPGTTTVTTSGVLVAPGDPPDTTKASATSTVSGVVTEKFTHVVHAHVDLVGSARINALVGADSVCGGAAGAISGATLEVDLASPAMLRIRASAEPGVQILSTQITNGADTLLIDATLGAPGTHERVIFAPPGTYVFTVTAVVIAKAPTSGTAHRAEAHGAASYDISYRDVGTATGPARGDGRRYVKTPVERSCLTDSLTTQLTGKARHARSAVFSVNGEVVRTVHDPKAGSLVLHDLPETRDVALSVALELSHHRTAVLHRTYYRCG